MLENMTWKQIYDTIQLLAVKVAELEAKLESQKLKDFMTLEEAAEYLCIPKSTLYMHCQNRTIPHNKPGKHSYFLRKDLDAYVKNIKFRVKSNRNFYEE